MHGLAVKAFGYSPLEIHQIGAACGNHNVIPIHSRNDYLIGAVVVVSHEAGGVVHIGGNVVITVVEDIEGSHHVHALAVVPRYGHGIHRYLIVEVLHRDDGRNRVVAGSRFVRMVCPVYSCFHALVANRAAHVQGESDVGHAVGCEINVLGKDQSAVVVKLNRDIRIGVDPIPVIYTHLDRDLIVLIRLGIGHRKVGYREVVIGLLPHRVEGDSSISRITATRAIRRARCGGGGCPTHEIVPATGGACRGQRETYTVGLDLRCRGTRTAVSAVRYGIGGRAVLPHGIQGSVTIPGVCASGTIRGCGCTTAGTPTTEGVVESGRHRRRQIQGHALGLGHSRRCARTTIGVEADRISHRGDILPHRVQGSGGVGRVTTARIVGGRECGTACTPTQESVSATGGLGRSESQGHALGLGLRGRRAGASVGVIGNRIGGGDLLPYGVECDARIGGITATCGIGCAGSGAGSSPAQEGVPASGGFGGGQGEGHILGLGLRGRRTRAAVGVVAYGVGCRRIYLPHSIQSHRRIGRVGIPRRVCHRGGRTTGRPSAEGISTSGGLGRG